MNEKLVEKLKKSIPKSHRIDLFHNYGYDLINDRKQAPLFLDEKIKEIFTEAKKIKNEVIHYIQGTVPKQWHNSEYKRVMKVLSENPALCETIAYAINPHYGHPNKADEPENTFVNSFIEYLIESSEGELTEEAIDLFEECRPHKDLDSNYGFPKGTRFKSRI